MTPVAKYMARSGAIHRNHIKAASRNATMNPPINVWSCVRRSRNHCNLLGIYSPSAASATKNPMALAIILHVGVGPIRASPTAKRKARAFLDPRLLS